MKKLVAIALLCAFLTGIAYANAPEKVVIKARKGNITFTHKQHEENGLLTDCTVCHDKDRGFKLGKQGMATGHSMCRKCHAENQAGPRDCDECHK